MRHTLLILCALLCIDSFAITKAKTSRKTESLQYDVYYHWGIIWMKAGRGELGLFDETTADGQQRIHAKLTGRTLSVAEKIMTVRDTLECWYTPDYLPLEFAKLTHEGSYQATERNFYKYNLKKGTEEVKADNVESTTVNVKRWRNKKGNDEETHTPKGITYDMLSAFYMVRGLDFENMKSGTVIQFPLVAGVSLQNLKIKYKGKSTTKLRSGKKITGYKVEMTIVAKGEEGAPLEVWLSTDKSHKPLNVILQLRRIGAIQCELSDGK